MFRHFDRAARAVGLLGLVVLVVEEREVFGARRCRLRTRDAEGALPEQPAVEVVHERADGDKAS